MTHPTAVILIVALSASVLDRMPRLRAFARGGIVRRLRPVLPAVTCSVQASMLTGLVPARHGIVGNGWFNRELGEVHFWKQSARLVAGERVWETARRRDPALTVAALGWWFSMYSTANVILMPRPIYKADGRKIPDCWTRPAELRRTIQARLGPFPLRHFWGPGASIVSSEWLAQAARFVHEAYAPGLSLVYLPHLDYSLQRDGPASPAAGHACAQIDAVAADLIEFYQSRGVRVMVVSEYGIEPVGDAVEINRVLRREGWIAVREEVGLELLDAGESRAFAVADHQVAHVYVRDPDDLARVAEACAATAGVAEVLDRPAQAARGLAHPRAGDLVLVSEPGRWFAYPYWLDDARAPDFARTVDIHRKPGYDPLELFLDPARRFPRLRLIRRVLQQRLGFRTLFDVIPLDPALVRGSHGRDDVPPDRSPVLITQHDLPGRGEELPCTAVRDIILEHLFDAET